MSEWGVLVAGIAAVTLLDAIGSVASRKLDFNYTILSPLSMLIYGTVGAMAAQATGQFFYGPCYRRSGRFV